MSTLDQALSTIETENEVLIPRDLFVQLCGIYRNFGVNDLDCSIIEACRVNTSDYLPDIDEVGGDFFDVTYRHPDGALGTLTLFANDLIDVVTWCRILLARNTDGHPSQFTLLEIKSTPDDKRPKPVFHANSDIDNTLSGSSIFD